SHLEDRAADVSTLQNEFSVSGLWMGEKRRKYTEERGESKKKKEEKKKWRALRKGDIGRLVAGPRHDRAERRELIPPRIRSVFLECTLEVKDALACTLTLGIDVDEQEWTGDGRTLSRIRITRGVVADRVLHSIRTVPFFFPLPPACNVTMADGSSPATAGARSLIAPYHPPWWAVAVQDTIHGCYSRDRRSDMQVFDRLWLAVSRRIRLLFSLAHYPSSTNPPPPPHPLPRPLQQLPPPPPTPMALAIATTATSLLFSHPRPLSRPPSP
ncbi:hypothetical protein L249_2658, partial [Ophiocordyceps polyrhachis-furcata BCC 54312]